MPNDEQQNNLLTLIDKIKEVIDGVVKNRAWEKNNKISTLVTNAWNELKKNEQLTEKIRDFKDYHLMKNAGLTGDQLKFKQEVLMVLWDNDEIKKSIKAIRIILKSIASIFGLTIVEPFIELLDLITLYLCQ